MLASEKIRYIKQGIWREDPNPFWNPSTAAIDFENYCTENNIAPDIVIIEFGLNEDNSADYYSAVQAFVSQVHKYDANIKIYVVQMFGEAEIGADNHNSARQRAAGARCVLEAEVLTNCTLIPAWYIIVDEYDYEAGTQDYGYDVTVPALADAIHPSEDVGFAKLGDLIYNYLGS